MARLAGWGRCPVVTAEEVLSEDLVSASEGLPLARGLGRSYGDASLPAPGDPRVLGTRLADRLLAFDPEAGVLRAEAGARLEQLNGLLWPRGLTPPVSPGTQQVTLGGMVASDVHGKNHHTRGSFGEHVRALRMRLADGRIVDVDENSEPYLFRATLGGMGLTGHILEVEFQLERVPTAWIREESVKVGDLAEGLACLRESSDAWPMTVAWSDTVIGGASFGRGLVSRGRWATEDEAPIDPPPRKRAIALPVDVPGGLLAPWNLRILYGVKSALQRRRVVRRVSHPETFFYPLDVLHDWNRAYGKQGFIQHQAVVPSEHGAEGVLHYFDTLARAGGCSFLTVIKDCGAEGRGLLSYPRPGISIAIDLPMRGDETQRIVDRLNGAVIELGGRIYPAKDALTRAEHFRRMEGARLDHFLAVREKWDPERRLRSALSVRLLGDGA